MELFYPSDAIVPTTSTHLKVQRLERHREAQNLVANVIRREEVTKNCSCVIIALLLLSVNAKCVSSCLYCSRKKSGKLWKRPKKKVFLLTCPPEP